MPDSRTVFKHGDDIYYIDAQSGQGRFGKCIKARPAFGPQAQDLLIHWVGLSPNQDRFISVGDPNIRVRRQVAAQLLCEGDDRPAMYLLTAPQAPKQRRVTADMSEDQLRNAVHDYVDRFCNWDNAELIEPGFDYPVEEDAHVEDRPKDRLRRTAATATATAKAVATAETAMTTVEVASPALTAATPTVDVATAVMARAGDAGDAGDAGGAVARAVVPPFTPPMRDDGKASDGRRKPGWGKGLAARGLVAKAPNTPGIDEPSTPAVGTGDAAEVMPLAVTPSAVAGAVDAGGDEVTPSAAAGAILPMKPAEGADDAMEVDGAGALETALALALGTAPVRSVGLSSQSMQAHASRLMSATSDASGGCSAVHGGGGGGLGGAGLGGGLRGAPERAHHGALASDTLSRSRLGDTLEQLEVEMAMVGTAGARAAPAPQRPKQRLRRTAATVVTAEASMAKAATQSAEVMHPSTTAAAVAVAAAAAAAAETGGLRSAGLGGGALGGGPGDGHADGHGDGLGRGGRGSGGGLGGAGLGDLGGDLGGAATRAPDGARVQVMFDEEGEGQAPYPGTVLSSSLVDGVWLHKVEFDDGETYNDMRFDELILKGQKKRGRRNPSRRGRARGKRQKKGGFTLHQKSEIRTVLGDDAVPRLAAPRQGELPLSLCWEETLHTIFYRLGMAQRLGLKRADFHQMYDPFVDTPDDYVVEWSRARGVLLRDATSLLCKSSGREPALAALRGARLYAVRARIASDGFDAPHVFFFDAERRHLMTNWHTSKVVEFDDHDATTVWAARTAIKHVDYAFLHDKRIEIQQLYEASLL